MAIIIQGPAGKQPALIPLKQMIAQRPRPILMGGPLTCAPFPTPAVMAKKAPAPITVNKPIGTIKRKRKVELAMCPTCGSPNMFGFSDLKQNMWDKNSVVTITLVCTNCHWEEKTQTRNNIPMYEAAFKDAVSKYYATIKSPNEATLTFKFFKFEKNKYQLQHIATGGGCDIHAFCEDAGGIMYRFGNESAKKILYFAVKERQFKCVMAYQKHWKKTQSSHGSVPQGTTLHFRQSPKVLGGIELIP